MLKCIRLPVHMFQPTILGRLWTCRYHIIGFHPRSYAWWGGLSYMIGAVQYNVASTTGLAYNFPRVAASWSTETYKWASIVMYTWGGGFFLIAGVCYVLLDMGLPGLWLGTRCLLQTTFSTQLHVPHCNLQHYSWDVLPGTNRCQVAADFASCLEILPDQGSPGWCWKSVSKTMLRCFATIQTDVHPLTG